MWLLDEDNGKEFVDDVIQLVFNDNAVMQSKYLIEEGDC